MQQSAGRGGEHFPFLEDDGSYYTETVTAAISPCNCNCNCLAAGFLLLAGISLSHYVSIDLLFRS
jgi:hypothetical protein